MAKNKRNGRSTIRSPQQLGAEPELEDDDDDLEELLELEDEDEAFVRDHFNPRGGRFEE